MQTQRMGAYPFSDLAFVSQWTQRLTLTLMLTQTQTLRDYKELPEVVSNVYHSFVFLFRNFPIYGWYQMFFFIQHKNHLITFTLNRMRRQMKRFLTRMHSSGMHTACLLTVSQYALCRGGCAQGGVCPAGVSASGPGREVCLWSQEGGLPLVPGGRGCIPACNGADTPSLSVDRHLRKHSLRKLRFAAKIASPGI